MESNHEVKDSTEREQMTNAAVQLAQREREDKAAAEERAKQEAAQKAVFVKEFPSLQPATPAPTASREAPSITADARSYMALCMRVSVYANASLSYHRLLFLSELCHFIAWIVTWGSCMAATLALLQWQGHMEVKTGPRYLISPHPL